MNTKLIQHTLVFAFSLWVVFGAHSVNATKSTTIKAKTTAKQHGLPSLKPTTSTTSVHTTATSSWVTSYYNSTGAWNSTMHTSSSSYNGTFSAVIPNTIGNNYIYRSNDIDGTVFIAFGSGLGFVFIALALTWTALAIKAWHSARKEYQLKELENKYQQDPFYFQSQAEYSDDSSGSYYSDNSSDVSEKVLKSKPSRLSIYSLGSTSALNLLNNTIQGNNIIDTNNYRTSMFISPTEILQQQKPASWSSGTESGTTFGSSSSTPREQNAMPVITSQQHYITQEYDQYTPERKSSELNGLGLSEIDTSTRDIQKKKTYRPPSVHLDQLLDLNT